MSSFVKWIHFLWGAPGTKPYLRVRESTHFWRSWRLALGRCQRNAKRSTNNNSRGLHISLHFIRHSLDNKTLGMLYKGSRRGKLFHNLGISQQALLGIPMVLSWSFGNESLTSNSLSSSASTSWWTSKSAIQQHDSMWRHDWERSTYNTHIAQSWNLTYLHGKPKFAKREYRMITPSNRNSGSKREQYKRDQHTLHMNAG